LSGNWAIAEKQ